MTRPCLECGALSDQSLCPVHRHRVRSTPGSTGARQAAFRAAVLARAEYRCQAVEDGARCGVTDSALLEAHHLAKPRDGGGSDPCNGVCLCGHHHHCVEAESDE
jgi:predicted restriction endonuclease